MFHVEQKIVLIWAASVYLGAAQLAAEPATLLQDQPSATANKESAIPLALATSNDEAASCIAWGMQEMLLGDDDAAADFFTKALAVDESCSPLANIGLYIARRSAAQDKFTISDLSVRIEEAGMTPPEAFYFTTLLLLANRDMAGAQKAFAERADKFRADLFSACWATQLLHYIEPGYDETGAIRPLQQQSLDRASALYKRYPDNPVVCYLRALVEESAPEISDDAVAAARNAAKLLPDHPTVLHTYGHILYRSGHIEESIAAFHSAWILAKAKKNELLALHARLYESVALWSAGQEDKAVTIRRELNKLKIDPADHSEKSVFLAWESHTLPFRILILRKNPPQQFEINAAFRTALPNGDKGKDSYTEAIRCLRDAVSVRLYCSQQKKVDAIVALKRAEASLKKIEADRANFIGKRTELITPWERLHRACVVAVNVARSELYPSTADTWKANIHQLSTMPSTLMLPPVTPTQKSAGK